MPARALPARAITAALLALLAGHWLLRAWFADDAYITYRVVDNLLAGHGLRWNPDDRVQVFTHPLWMLLQVPWTAALGSPTRASVALSTLCLGVTLFAAWRACAAGRVRFLLLVAAPLALSRAFSDYAISGLEAPLSAALAAGFAALALARPQGPHGLALGAVLGLAAWNRLDALVALVPAAAVLGWNARRQLAPGRLALGLLPPVGWLLFSLFYYGFALPNTKPAKLDTGIAALDLLGQGGFYCLDFARHDAGSALLLGLGLGFGAAALRRGLAETDGERRARAWVLAGLAAGIPSHTAYVAAIGGDFMRGRLFVVPVVLAALVLGRALCRAPRTQAALAAAAVALGALASAAVYAGTPPDALARGIADERAQFAPHTGLWASGRPEQHPWAQAGIRARDLAPAEGPWLTRRRGAVGLLGYYAGPRVVVIDNMGLGDPLLARLPVADPKSWRIGHFWRTPPEGYEEARASGDSSGMDADLRRYHEKLRLLVAGPLFSAERLREIARFQLGSYDPWRDAYLERR